MSVVLDDREKKRLLLQEQYRFEVRQRLEKTRSDSEGRISKFLNSTFGIWLLSAVFVTGGGAAIAQWQKSRDEDRLELERQLQDAKENEQAIARLDMEISYRLSQGLLALGAASDQIKTVGPKDPDQRKLALARVAMGTVQLLAGPARPTQPPLYPEFAAFGLPTLMSELRRRVGNSEAEPVGRSLAALLGAANSQSFVSLDPAEEAAASLLKLVMLPRWRGTAFYYVDCSTGKPFC